MKQQVAQLYQHCAWKDRFYFQMKWRRGNIFELCESFVPKQGTIVDVGCGTGILANLCSLNGPERNILGLDLDETRVSVATSTVGDRSNLEFRVQKLEDVDESNVSAVLVMDVIHHISLDLTRGLFQTIYDMLQPGGTFLLKDIDVRPAWKYYLNYTIDWWNTRRSFTLGADLTFRPPTEIQSDLESIGFEVQRPPLPGKGTCPHALYICKKKA